MTVGEVCSVSDADFTLFSRETVFPFCRNKFDHFKLLSFSFFFFHFNPWIFFPFVFFSLLMFKVNHPQIFPICFTLRYSVVPSVSRDIAGTFLCPTVEFPSHYSSCVYRLILSTRISACSFCLYGHSVLSLLVGIF